LARGMVALRRLSYRRQYISKRAYVKAGNVAKKRGAALRAPKAGLISCYLSET